MPPRYKETKDDQKTHGDGPVLQHWLNNSYIQGLSYVNMEVWEANKVMHFFSIFIIVNARFLIGVGAGLELPD